ncbi:MAG: hypothetical protein LBH63_04485 [Clostridiales Family XIII bacterium]|jgi:hypothetical protein|nr:hypothetical protein [Clostridiales Family XIII bacterium]
MIHIRNSRIKIAIVGALTLFSALYICFVAPVFQERIDKLRMENKLLARDIAAIDEMRGDLTALKKDIADAEGKLSAIRERTSVGPAEVAFDISEKADAAGIAELDISEQESLAAGDKTAYGAQLFSRAIDISASGDFASGLRFMRSLEDSETGFYSVVGFAHSGGAEGDATSQWIFRVTLYYYEG